jgi:hypothetical protein
LARIRHNPTTAKRCVFFFPASSVVASIIYMTLAVLYRADVLLRQLRYGE